ncbi:MAG: 2Fe-2S iron-sulfur cluster-binding protein, partial [Burkholderiales bacterium]
MAKFKLNGVEVEAADGAPLVEAVKENGVWISNLCYIDGLPPYAGCRTCLVEIEGARGLQLACTSRVTEGMVVRSNTAAVLDARQAVLSIINANHSDRCLTCHRRVHCMPGDICLRDDTVTHRCLTCAKNYRCELQNTNEMLQMANYEPWLGEERTYYESEAPEADRANPFLEFDPQMCIICTRCVRACEDIQEVGVLDVAQRGAHTEIIVGGDGDPDHAGCTWCGECVRVCPTGAIFEFIPKQRFGSDAVRAPDKVVRSVCPYCGVGCQIDLQVKGDQIMR